MVKVMGSFTLVSFSKASIMKYIGRPRHFERCIAANHDKFLAPVTLKMKK